MTTNDDILLLKLIKEGDEHAFKHLFDNYFTPLCRYINIYLDNFAEAEELALDIFTYLWENREQVDIRLSFKAYLFRLPATSASTPYEIGNKQQHWMKTCMKPCSTKSILP